MLVYTRNFILKSDWPVHKGIVLSRLLHISNTGWNSALGDGYFFSLKCASMGLGEEDHYANRVLEKEREK